MSNMHQDQEDGALPENIDGTVPETASEREKRIMESVRQTQLSTALTLKSIDNTLASVDETLRSVAVTQQKLDDFSSGFSTAMTDMATKLFTQQEESYVPEISDIETVTRELIRCSNVIIALGQESSLVSQSEIESIRREYVEYRCGNTNNFWDSYHDLHARVNHMPFELNRYLARTLMKVNHEGQMMIIVSDVVDGLMKRSFTTFQSFEGGMNTANKQIVMEFSGNINTLCCEIPDCPQQEYAFTVGLQELDASCPKCSAEGVYNNLVQISPSIINPQSDAPIETLYSQVDERTCLVLLGSTFISPIIQQLISIAIENSALIVEISETPKIDFGRVKQLIGDPKEIACGFCENIIENFY